MSFLKEEERREKGASLVQSKQQATATINRLKSIINQIIALKTVVNNDAVGAAVYFTADDVTDVQSVLDYINTEIAGI